MVKKGFFIVVAVLVSAVFLNVGFYFVYPDVSKLKKASPKKTAFMEYREKEWEKQGKKKKIIRQWVPLSQISPYVIKAVIIAEDDKFWSHEGFDFDAIQKAIEKDIKNKKFKFGGSTISQQLAKNLYLSPSKNPVRKIKEAILTWRMENHLSKKRIIELYLNVAEWGEGVFGIEAAARRYYGKPASALTAKEAARLASVLPNPRKFDPTGESKFVEGRSERIYQIMVRRGIVIPEYEEVMSEPAQTEGTEQEKPEKTPEPPSQGEKDGSSAQIDNGKPDGSLSDKPSSAEQEAASGKAVQGEPQR
ncbi:MAG: monofunctional biosynthetic peptidoglycan transglycosylase [Deltaproteobacteria bacterium]|nr:monofunctional biosynthetic peptidoglycan transglycosylase [Deltaproteobacteria bacterium]